jgi:hypothetical protein
MFTAACRRVFRMLCEHAGPHQIFRGALALALAGAVVWPASAQAICTTTSTALCLQAKRFRVEIEWSGYVGDSGIASTVPGATPDSGLFYFFGPNNWEVLVKVIDACQQNDRFWVFAAAATSLQYTITVTDTQTGAVRTYSNPLDNPAPAITDIGAFATCSGTASGAEVRYYNNVFCNGVEPFTSTLTMGSYNWQSLTQVASPYQLVQVPTLGPTFVETNGSTCGPAGTYNGAVPIQFGRRYSIAQTFVDGGLELQVLDEGATPSAAGIAAVAPLPPEAPPRVVGRLRPAIAADGGP